MPRQDDAVRGNASNDVLVRRIRLRAILSVLTRQATVLVALVVIPMLIALADSEFVFAIRLAICACALSLLRFLRMFFELPDDLQTHEALAVVALTFLIGSFAVVWPFMSFGLSFVDAFFESMSGLTTTGFTMIENIETWPVSAQLTRAWLQWCGGLAILVSAFALILPSGSAARRFGLVSIDDETILASMRRRGRIVLSIYVTITLVCLLATWWASSNALTALSLTLAAVSTGGFAVDPGSLAASPILLSAVLIVFAVLGAIPIDHYIYLKRLQPRRFFADTEISTLFVLLAMGALGLIATDGWQEATSNGGQVSTSFSLQHRVSQQLDFQPQRRVCLRPLPSCS